MVYKAVTGGTTDLNNAADFYGIEDDLIVILSGANVVITWAGDDLIDGRRPVSSDPQVIFAGDGNDKVYGSRGEDSVADGDGDDYITLGAADDFLNADLGNDTYVGGTGTDVITFDAINVVSNMLLQLNTEGVTFDLAKTTAQNLGSFGFDTVSGFEDAIGGRGADVLSGTNGANSIVGFDGNDRLDGRGGNDVLEGEKGTDVLTGGTGLDTLIGGLGRDFFDFNSKSESVKGANRDTITDFVRAQGDKIDLFNIDADIDGTLGNQKFSFIGTHVFTGVDGQLRASGGIVQGDVNGDRIADFEIKVNLATLVAGDFIL